MLALAWMTLALQPCATAQEHGAVPSAHAGHVTALHAEPAMHHAGAHHGNMGGATELPQRADPCPPGADCPVFKAIADQAAAKIADPLDVPLQIAPALFASWRMPVYPANAQNLVARTAFSPIPEPPVLAFRVLLI